ncbi:MAG: cbb3-type cytochrome oxidase assembly protein CcoS [Rhodobacteraceae bacterium]|nr:cbb3-type cytochrome oxidase assembly protein CcoS [Paracoccaceae bacterium]
MFLIPISILMGLIALGACIWSLKAGQNADPEGARYRIFGDDTLNGKLDPKIRGSLSPIGNQSKLL